MVTPTAPAENRTRGVLLARLGRRDEAAEQLERYLRLSPSAADSKTVRAMAKGLREGRDLSNDVGAV